MESKPEGLMSEKAYCHTYDSLVREMASRMVINDEKILPKEGDKFDYEDINSWIGAVDFAEGKTPDIEVRLSSRKGKDVVKFETQEQETVKSADEKVGNKKLLYSMALTEAKMKVISDIAEDTYPAVAFQIKDYRKEMEKVREEILGNKKENTSLDEVINRVMSKKTLAAALIIGGMILSACGSGIEVTSKAAATETQPRVTETVEIGVTATPTVEVTPTAEVVIPDPLVAIEKFNLDSERTYTLSEDGYLVDTFNQANMAKWNSEIGEWTDTTLEEKYGHLVPSDKEMASDIAYGNYFCGGQKDSWQMYDRRWETVRLLTRSNGNVKTVESFSEEVQMNIVNIYGEVLLRDKEGKIHLLNVRLDAVNPTGEFGLWVCSVNQEEPTESDLCGSGNLLRMDSLKEEVDYYSKPGQYILVEFSTKLWGNPPTKNIDHGRGFTSIKYITSFHDWLRNKAIYQSLADALAKKTVPDDLPDDFVIYAQIASIYMDMDELIKIWKE
jgi:hypothetical protein